MIYRFDPFSLDTGSLELRQGDEVLAVEPQVFSLLAYLIENRDRVISKDELIEAVWGGRAISDGALNSRINAARRAVGDDGTAQSVIKTFTRRGFRFIGLVIEDDERESQANPPALQTGKPSIAVLPFDNMSGDPEQEYFSDGITEDLITALSRMRRFRVIARNSTFSYKGRSTDIRHLACELDCQYVVEGSVRKVGNRIRLTAQLIAGVSGQHVWAEKYDRELDDIFALQDELTLAIAGAIEPAMNKAEQERVKRLPPESLNAWESYQRGMFYLHKHTKKDLGFARDLFQQAISIDQEFAPAYAGAARTYFFNTLYGFTEGDGEEALGFAEQAVELDVDDAESHLALGLIHYVNRDNNLAIPEFEKAISLNPTYAAAHHGLGTSLVQSGKAEDALPHLLAAIRLSPKDAEIGPFHARLAMAHFYLRQHDEAVEWAQKAVRLPGIQWPAHCVLVAALAQSGKAPEADKAVLSLLAFRPGITVTFVCEHLPTVDPNDINHLLDGLRKAGLPE